MGILDGILIESQLILSYTPSSNLKSNIMSLPLLELKTSDLKQLPMDITRVIVQVNIAIWTSYNELSITNDIIRYLKEHFNR